MDSAWLVLAGGLAVFLHGLDQAKAGLQFAAGDRLRRLIGSITRNRVVGASAGLVFTLVIQSSTAVTLMVVDYCAAGMCDFAEAFAVLLGAGLGTTFIVQIITFKISAYALLIVAIGVVVRLATRAGQATGQILIGLGLLFYGLETMSSGVAPLLQGPAGAEAVQFLADRPVLSVIAAAALTVLLQGSAPTIGLVLSVSSAGKLSLDAALPLVLGANIGTTITPLLHALTKPLAGRRAAVANLAVKVVGAAIVLPVVHPLAIAVAATADNPARRVANAHTLYNLIIMVIGLVFLEPLARAVERFYSPDADERTFGARHLSTEAIDTPALAFGQAMRELMNMAEIVGEMLRSVAEPLLGEDAERTELIEAEDDKVDLLNREIRFYLARLGADRMSDLQAERRMQLINVCSDLEGIGDVITRSLVPMARKRNAKGVSFSDEGRAELDAFHAQIADTFETAVSAFAASDEELARRAQRLMAQAEEEEARLRRKHIERLQKSERASIETSSIHLDVLTDFARVAGLCESLVLAATRQRATETGAA